MDVTDRALERRILELLADREVGRTICPSDAARAVYREAKPAEAGSDPAGETDEGWRELMDPVRQAARRLVAAGRLEITQRGEVVDPDTTTGPIRLRLPRDDDRQ